MAVRIPFNYIHTKALVVTAQAAVEHIWFIADRIYAKWGARRIGACARDLFQGVPSRTVRCVALTGIRK